LAIARIADLESTFIAYVVTLFLWFCIQFIAIRNPQWMNPSKYFQTG